MARVPAAARESVPQSQQDAFDEIVHNRGGVPRTGPGSIMINESMEMLGISDKLR